MYDKEGFKKYFLDVVGASSNSMNTYNSFLNRMDIALSGLDEKIEEGGGEALMNWTAHADIEPFVTYRSHARSVLKRYLQYRLEHASDSIEDVVGDNDLTPVENDANFKIEKEMQAQVRKQIAALESGLKIVDGGSEVSVATGYIDILARDANGTLVAIELKAGKCPAGAIEQILGYAQSLSEERQEPARAMLIAGQFGDRLRAAAKRCVDLELKSYAYSLAFAAVD